MATYTITINEKTSSGKLLLAYLVGLGLINEKKEPKGDELTMSAIDELKKGKGRRYTKFDDFEKRMNEI